MSLVPCVRLSWLSNPSALQRIVRYFVRYRVVCQVRKAASSRRERARWLTVSVCRWWRVTAATTRPRWLSSSPTSSKTTGRTTSVLCRTGATNLSTSHRSTS